MTLNADTVYFDQSSYNAGMIADDSFENLKEKNARRRIRRNIFYVVFGLAMCIVFAVACVALFFNTEEILVEGCGIYDDYLIRESSGITKDQNLCFIDAQAVENAIIMQYPYVKSVDVQLHFPSTVTLVIKEETPTYYFELCGEYFILSESLRVLEITDDLANRTVPDSALISLKTLNVAYAVAGRQIVFEDEDYYTYAQKMLSTFERSAIAEHITLIDFSDKYNIYIIYDHRFRIEFGTADDISSKITMAQKIVEVFEDHDTGVINVESDPGYAILDSVRTER